VAKKERPVIPERSCLYATKTQLAVRLLQAFKDAHGDIKIKAVLADALYGEKVFKRYLWMKPHAYSDGAQVISQLRENQNIGYKGKKRNLKDYFNTKVLELKYTANSLTNKEISAIKWYNNG